MDNFYINTLPLPKTVAKVKLCGDALTFNITDTMSYELPTDEQCKNLKETFGIEVEKTIRADAGSWLTDPTPMTLITEPAAIKTRDEIIHTLLDALDQQEPGCKSSYINYIAKCWGIKY
jgi:hypothetical protein